MKCYVSVCGDVLIVGRGGIRASEMQYLLRINVRLENLRLITPAITHFNNKQLIPFPAHPNLHVSSRNVCRLEVRTKRLLTIF